MVVGCGDAWGALAIIKNNYGLPDGSYTFPFANKHIHYNTVVMGHRCWCGEAWGAGGGGGASVWVARMGLGGGGNMTVCTQKDAMMRADVGEWQGVSCGVWYHPYRLCFDHLSPA